MGGCGAAAAVPLRDDPAPAAQSVALVWGLHDPDRAARRLRRVPEVAEATVLGRGAALLRARKPGYAIPLDAIAVNPRRYAQTVPPAARGAFARLRRGTTVISRTEAGLRGAGVGTVLRLTEGRRMRVVAIVADALLRDAEVAVAAGDPRVPPLRSTVIAALRGPVTRRELVRATQRGAAARILPGGPLRASGPIGPARPGTLKVRFGEPAVGLPYGSDWIRLDPAFVRRHIVSRRVPILGSAQLPPRDGPAPAGGDARAGPPRAARPRRPRRLRGLLRAAADPAARSAVAARVGPGGRPQRLA